VTFLVQWSISQGTKNATEYMETIKPTEQEIKDGHYSTEKRLERSSERQRKRRLKAYNKMGMLFLGLVAVLGSGTLFYSFVFGWPLHDSLWFCVVTGASVGYGDVLPTTDAEKLFSIFYMLFGCIGVSTLLNEFVKIYVVEFTEERILGMILDSTTFVHKADLKGDGRVTEAEYTAFKLQQMQKLDKKLAAYIATSFKELDANQSGRIEIGDDIPYPRQWDDDFKMKQCESILREAGVLEKYADKKRKELGTLRAESRARSRARPTGPRASSSAGFMKKDSLSRGRKLTPTSAKIKKKTTSTIESA